VADDKPTSPWREAPYTTLPNSYLLRLAKSDLTARATRALFVILTETRGSPGQKRKDYGRETKDVGKELLQAGWLRLREPAAGSRARTFEPLLQPRPRRRLEPVPEVEPEAQATGRAISQAYLARKEQERREAALRRARGESCG
jgi:hypothetical protein